jgi:hypothetical protein
MSKVACTSFAAAEEAINEAVDNLGHLLQEQKALNMRKETAIQDFKSIAVKGVNHRLFTQDRKQAQIDKNFKIGNDREDENEPEEPKKVDHDIR